MRAGILKSLFCICLLGISGLLFCAQSVQETLAQCRRDLRSDLPETRRAALLLLGKYDTPEVAQLLGELLADRDVAMRLSALTAALEHPQMLPRLAPGILRRIADESLDVRRLASSSALACMHSLGWYAGRRAQRQPNAQGAARLADQELEELLVAGLRDPDADVRRNCLAAAAEFRALPQESLREFLQEGTPAVEIVRALPLLTRAAETPEKAVALLEGFSRHPEAVVRREVVEELSRTFCTAAFDALKPFEEDADPRVRILAYLGRVRLFLMAGAVLPKDLEVFLFSDEAQNLESSEAEEILGGLEALPPDAFSALAVRLLNEPASRALQRATWRTFLRHREWQAALPAELLLSSLENCADDRMTANIILSMLKKRAPELGMASLMRLQQSPNPLCRQWLLELLPGVPACAQRSELLQEALLDEAAEVRRKALELSARLRIDGWQQILIATLEDDDPLFQHTAARLLYLQKPLSDETRAALTEWLPHCRDAQLAMQIQRTLAAQRQSAAGKKKK